MYSIVLMAAVATSGPDAASFGKRGGCSGCYGGCYGSCYGASYSYGCCGGYSYGCCGGYSYGCGGGGLFHKHKSYGCCGGYTASYGCCGGYSCFGSAYGGSCYGGCYGATYPAYSYPGYYGGYNAPPVVTVPAAPGTVTPTTPVVPNPMTPVVPKPEKKPETSGMGANLKFSLPEGSKLFVDGRLVGTGGERSFYTPALVPGQKYFYEVKAELAVDGRTVTEEKTVIVEAGANLTETFPKLTAAAAAPTAVAGK